MPAFARARVSAPHLVSQSFVSIFPGNPFLAFPIQSRVELPRGVAMNRPLTSLSLVLLVALLAGITLSCGSGGGRQLQSITINATASGNQVQLVATGGYSAPPTTVTPLPVFWTIDLPTGQYTLTTQPNSIQCTAGAYPGPYVAWAPVDPNAPSSGSISATPMVSQSIGCSDVTK
jgi:hypothetical protein